MVAGIEGHAPLGARRVYVICWADIAEPEAGGEVEHHM